MNNKKLALILACAAMAGTSACNEVGHFCDGQNRCENNVITICEGNEVVEIIDCNATGEICDTEEWTCISGAADCTNGSMQCSGDIVQECKGGKWEDKTDCSTQTNKECKQSGTTASCQEKSGPVVCAENVKQCDGEILQICHNNAWETDTDCSTLTNKECKSDGAGSYACMDKAAVDCDTEGALQCSGDVLQKCTDGTWADETNCANNTDNKIKCGDNGGVAACVEPAACGDKAHGSIRCKDGVDAADGAREICNDGTWEATDACATTTPACAQDTTNGATCVECLGSNVVSCTVEVENENKAVYKTKVCSNGSLADGVCESGEICAADGKSCVDPSDEDISETLCASASETKMDVCVKYGTTMYYVTCASTTVADACVGTTSSCAAEGTDKGCVAAVDCSTVGTGRIDDGTGKCVCDEEHGYFENVDYPEDKNCILNESCTDGALRCSSDDYGDFVQACFENSWEQLVACSTTDPKDEVCKKTTLESDDYAYCADACSTDDTLCKAIKDAEYADVFVEMSCDSDGHFVATALCASGCDNDNKKCAGGGGDECKDGESEDYILKDSARTKECVAYDHVDGFDFVTGSNTSYTASYTSAATDYTLVATGRAGMVDSGVNYAFAEGNAAIMFNGANKGNIALTVKNGLKAVAIDIKPGFTTSSERTVTIKVNDTECGSGTVNVGDDYITVRCTGLELEGDVNVSITSTGKQVVLDNLRWNDNDGGSGECVPGCADGKLTICEEGSKTVSNCAFNLCSTDNTACLEDELATGCTNYEMICVKHNGDDWRVVCDGAGKAYTAVDYAGGGTGKCAADEECVTESYMAECKAGSSSCEDNVCVGGKIQHCSFGSLSEPDDCSGIDNALTYGCNTAGNACIVLTCDHDLVPSEDGSACVEGGDACTADTECVDGHKQGSCTGTPKACDYSAGNCVSGFAGTDCSCDLSTHTWDETDGCQLIVSIEQCTVVGGTKIDKGSSGCKDDNTYATCSGVDTFSDEKTCAFGCSATGCVSKSADADANGGICVDGKFAQLNEDGTDYATAPDDCDTELPYCGTLGGATNCYECLTDTHCTSNSDYGVGYTCVSGLCELTDPQSCEGVGIDGVTTVDVAHNAWGCIDETHYFKCNNGVKNPVDGTDCADAEMVCNPNALASDVDACVECVSNSQCGTGDDYYGFLPVCKDNACDVDPTACDEANGYHMKADNTCVKCGEGEAWNATDKECKCDEANGYHLNGTTCEKCGEGKAWNSATNQCEDSCDSSSWHDWCSNASEGTLRKCVDGFVVEETCAAGCKDDGNGDTDDVCNTIYCSIVGLADDVVYGKYSASTAPLISESRFACGDDGTQISAWNLIDGEAIEDNGTDSEGNIEKKASLLSLVNGEYKCVYEVKISDDWYVCDTPANWTGSVLTDSLMNSAIMTAKDYERSGGNNCTEGSSKCGTGADEGYVMNCAYDEEHSIWDWKKADEVCANGCAVNSDNLGVCINTVDLTLFSTHGFTMGSAGSYTEIHSKVDGDVSIEIKGNHNYNTTSGADDLRIDSRGYLRVSGLSSNVSNVLINYKGTETSSTLTVSGYPCGEGDDCSVKTSDSFGKTDGTFIVDMSTASSDYQGFEITATKKTILNSVSWYQ